MKKYTLENGRKYVAFIAVAIVTVSCFVQCTPKQTTAVSSVPNTTPQADLSKGLKDYFKNDFLMGVAVSSRSIRTDSALILREFNSLTAENDMKVGVIHPAEDRWNWKNADDIVAFAERHKIKIRGHNLLWHNQNAEWMFTGPDGKPASKELVLQRLKTHIFTIMNRYKGKMYAWDVVNEAIEEKNPDANKMYRDTKWLEAFGGPEFIEAAFRFAREADPSAKLYYNDFNSERPDKREKIFKLLKKLKADKVPIDGVGFQAHWTVGRPSAAEIRTALDQVVSLGLDIQVTELDITVYPKPAPIVPGKPAVDPGFTPEAEAMQIAKYKEVFDIFRQYKKHINSVTFWNVSDRGSWLDSRGGGSAGDPIPNPPIRLKAYPLLFDVDGQRKKAYWAVVNN
ncbi:MAG: endo-1,4-beta-xylanase [Sphingobacteriaceae bacterium]|nr:MAG: endo-1,4-beta-xylanase [Sphingobacteriaceae bacterium]